MTFGFRTTRPQPLPWIVLGAVAAWTPPAAGALFQGWARRTSLPEGLSEHQWASGECPLRLAFSSSAVLGGF